MSEAKPHFDFLDLPDVGGPAAPSGVAFAIDHGLPHAEVDELLSTCGEWVEMVKFGWGTGYITRRLPAKIRSYREYDVEVFFGGTLFELAALQDSVGEYTDALEAFDVGHVEVSAGTVAMTHEEKCEHISRLADSFDVLSEVGPKDCDAEMSPAEWARRCRRELDAGASRVILEGRASGQAGVYQSDGAIRQDVVERVLDRVPLEDLIFEAPQKRQQAWFINRFGPRVNLGNVPLADVLPVRTLQLGLRGDTLRSIHGGDHR